MATEPVASPAIHHPLNQRPSWKELSVHARQFGKQHLRKLFAADPHVLPFRLLVAASLQSLLIDKTAAEVLVYEQDGGVSIVAVSIASG
jgi:hypothetical protein